MEIIKRGTPPGDRMYIGTCNSCKTEVRFKQSEAQSGDQRDPGYYVRCPVCASYIWGKPEGSTWQPMRD